MVWSSVFWATALCVVCLWPVKAATTFNCKNDRNLYINTPDYVVSCDINTSYTITFGPLVQVVKPINNCAWLTEVTFSDSVTTIEDEAFYFCYELSSVNFGKNLNRIGDNSFYYATSLKSLVIPDSVTYIGNSAFSGTRSLTSLVLGNSLQTIGNFCFLGSAITGDLVLPNSLRSLGVYSFAGLRDVTSITINEGLIVIPEAAFQNVSQAKSISISNSVETVEINAFSGLHSCENVHWGTRLKKIGDSAFRGSIGTLKTLEIPNSVVTVGNEAFRGCSEGRCQIDSVVLGSRVESIGNNAFSELISIRSIEIPKSVTEIGDSAFSGCSMLECIYWDSTVSRTISTNAFEDCPLSGCGLSFLGSNSKLPTDRIIPTYFFTMRQYMNGISAPDFLSLKGNSELFTTMVSMCTDEEPNIVQVKITQVTDSKRTFNLRGLLFHRTEILNSSLLNILIDYEVHFVAATMTNVELLYNVMVDNLINSTESGEFTQYMQEMASQYNISDAMYDASSSFSEVIESLFIPGPVVDDFTDDVEMNEKNTKKKGLDTITIIIALVVGIGGGFWCIVALALVCYYFNHRSDKIVPTEPNRRYEVVQMSGKNATSARTNTP